MEKDIEKVNVLYNNETNELAIPVNSDRILPAFLHYLLEYHQIPQNATLYFNDKTVRLKKTKESYEYEEV